MRLIQSSEELQLFSRLFSGYENAHGQYEINKKEDSGKVLGKAITYPRPAAAEDYLHHLNGSVGIGIIPLLKSDSCWFGAIDIDIKGDTKLHDSHYELEARVRSYKLPLMMFRSKSDGVHLYLFGKEPISARLMQARLEEFAALLGYGGCEVFPKQVTRIKNDGSDFGNWINIPLFGDTRKAIFEGKELEKIEALRTSQYLAVTESELRAFNAHQSEIFKDGPPCLQSLATIGIGEGNRNNILFNAGIYFRKKFPEEWQEQIREFNSSKIDPPLDDSEVKEIIRQLAKTEYSYTCKNPPICNLCDRKKCLKRAYGVGSSDDTGDINFELPIKSLTKYIAGDGDSYRWGVNTGEAMLEFGTEELLNIDAHRRKFAELLNLIIPPMKNKMFFDQIQVLMHKCEVVYDPEDASETGQLIANIESWFLDKGSARNVDEMVKQRWWLNPENSHIYFRSEALEDFLVHQKKMRNINKHKLWRLLEGRFKATKDRLNIKGKRRRVYVLKDFSFEDDKPFDVPDIERKEQEI